MRNQKYHIACSPKTIEEKLAYLNTHLPRKPTKNNYQLSNKILLEGIKSTTGDLQQKLQSISDKMRNHLLIKKDIKVLTISSISGGKFEQIDNLNCIYISDDLTHQNYRQKIAILAHEISHYYLIHQHHIKLENTSENELLTEINAIYVGFGFQLLDGYKTFKRKSNGLIYNSKVGYIDTKNVMHTIVKTAYVRKQNPIWILKNVKISLLPFFLFRLFKLIKNYYRAKKTIS